MGASDTQDTHQPIESELVEAAKHEKTAAQMAFGYDYTCWNC